MELIKYTIGIIRKRPFLIISFAMATLAYGIANSLNPFISLLLGFSAIGGGNIFDSMINFLQLIFSLLSDIKIFLISLMVFACTVAIVSALSGLFFSGYFHVLNNTLQGKPKTDKEFITGVKKFFPGIFLMVVRTIAFGVFFVLFMMISSVPAIVVTKALFTGKPELLIASILFIIVTLCVLFFGLMFFRIYISYWYPSALFYKKGAFSAGKRLANTYFWDILKKFLIFDLIFLVFQLLFVFLDNSISLQEHTNFITSGLLFISSWIFNTVFFLLFMVYIFTSYRDYREDLKEQNTQDQQENKKNPSEI